MIKNKSLQEIVRRVLNEEKISTKSQQIINNVISYIKQQTGLDLEIDDSTGLKKQRGYNYFNILLNTQVSESSEYDKLEQFANKYKLIKIQPNGYKRVAIFFNNDLLDKIK
jgi:hypothetical protein